MSSSKLCDGVFFDGHIRALASNLDIILADGQPDIAGTVEAGETFLAAMLEDINAGAGTGMNTECSDPNCCVVAGLDFDIVHTPPADHYEVPPRNQVGGYRSIASLD
jgi:hypothetical protein